MSNRLSAALAAKPTLAFLEHERRQAQHKKLRDARSRAKHPRKRK